MYLLHTHTHRLGAFYITAAEMIECASSPLWHESKFDSF
jgi:hypothetical protein